MHPIGSGMMMKLIIFGHHFSWNQCLIFFTYMNSHSAKVKQQMMIFNVPALSSSTDCQNLVIEEGLSPWFFFSERIDQAALWKYKFCGVTVLPRVCKICRHPQMGREREREKFFWGNLQVGTWSKKFFVLIMWFRYPEFASLQSAGKILKKWKLLSEILYEYRNQALRIWFLCSVCSNDICLTSQCSRFRLAYIIIQSTVSKARQKVDWNKQQSYRK